MECRLFLYYEPGYGTELQAADPMATETEKEQYGRKIGKNREKKRTETENSRLDTDGSQSKPEKS